MSPCPLRLVGYIAAICNIHFIGKCVLKRSNFSVRFFYMYWKRKTFWYTYNYL